MRAPTPSEPKFTFPTYQVPQVSAMRGSAPPVQVARAAWGGRADSPSAPATRDGPHHSVGRGAPKSVITGSSCRPSTPPPRRQQRPDGAEEGNFNNINRMMQSVTENCLLNSVTVPKIQRKGRPHSYDSSSSSGSTGTGQAAAAVAHNNNNKNNINNSDKLDSKFGALLPLGRDIPNQKSDDLEVLDDLYYNNNNNGNALNQNLTTSCDNNDCYNNKSSEHDFDNQHHAAPLRLRGGGESSLSTGTSGWGTPPSQQASNNNGKFTNYFIQPVEEQSPEFSRGDSSSPNMKKVYTERSN